VLVPRAAALDWRILDGVGTLGLTAGASAPERLVAELIDMLAARFELAIEERQVARESVVFKLPDALAS
ncbi:MAG: 4-hydroxy-3-methylbut-2-enyl diphosphate reductase, partial [Acetobacteraceae bacterium]